MARTSAELTPNEILLVAALDALANSGASQAIQKTGATSLANVNVAASLNFSEEEVPTGAINGVNKTFTLANTPTAGSVHLYLNGVRQRAGAGNDYTISGLTITTTAAPASGDVLVADYRY